MGSVNTYDKAANGIRQPVIEQKVGVLDVRELIRHATLAASSHNTQPWKFRIQQNSITILPDFSRRCPVVDPDDSHLFKSLGCAAENLVHSAAARGFSADVRFDPNEEEVNIFLTHDASAHATDLYRAINKRQCVKTAYDGTLLTTSELEMLEKISVGRNVRTIMLQSASQKEVVIDFVSKGNIAQLSDPSFRDELESWIRFNSGEALRKADGISWRTSGQPSLPTWLGKRIIGLVLTPKGQAEIDTKYIRSSAGVAIFVSNQNDKEAWVETGRVYERFALQATALNVRTAFINQPIEVRALRAQFESWLNLNGEHVQLMVRFGHAPAAPLSLRRQIDDVLVAN